MKFILAVLLIVIAAGPAYPEDKALYQLQLDIIQLKEQVKQIQSTVDTDNSVMKGLVEKMADQVNTLSGAMQKISATVDGLKNQDDSGTKEMRTILSGINSTVSDLKEDMSSVRSEVNKLSGQVTSMKTTSEPLAKPDDVWRSAYLDYSAGNYDLAIGDFQDFLAKYPTDDRAADAHLMMAETFAAQKKYDQALNEYDIVLQKYPDSDKSKTALLKKGYALADSNQVPQAISTLKEVVTKYPNTTEASAASLRMKDLTTAGRKTQPAGRQGTAK